MNGFRIFISLQVELGFNYFCLFKDFSIVNRRKEDYDSLFISCSLMNKTSNLSKIWAVFVAFNNTILGSCFHISTGLDFNIN